MEFLVSLLALALLAGPAQVPRPTPVLSGAEQLVPFSRKSSVLAIAERHAASPYTLRRLNDLDNSRRARSATMIFVSTRYIAPRPFQDGIVINLPAFRLFLLRKGEVVGSWPVALGRDFDREWKNQKRWRTPVGTFKVQAKYWHPDWIVPKDLQKKLETPRQIVPYGDPEYPLGEAKLQLTSTGLTIHGTNSPRSIGRLASHGCIRMWNSAVKQLYKEVKVGTPVALVYAPIQVVEHGGRVWLEVNSDVYGLAGDLRDRASTVLSGARLQDRVDPAIVARTVAAAPGVAIDVTGPVREAFETAGEPAPATRSVVAPSPKPAGAAVPAVPVAPGGSASAAPSSAPSGFRDAPAP